MPEYAIFGGGLRSEIPIPELRDAPPGTPRWVLTTAAVASPMGNPELLGELEITPTVHARLFRHDAGFRLQFDDTGTYDVLAGGARLVWTPGPEPNPGAVRADVTGRVLSTALHAAGLLCLHGSAVALDEGTVAFLAPKYHGKSTLALALTRAGGRLVTDDVLPVMPGPPVRAMPGVHQVKLWDDSARAFGVTRDDVEPGEKHLVRGFAHHAIAHEATPLAAVYLLVPRPPEAPMSAPAERERVPGVMAAMAMVRHATLGPLLGGEEAAVVFERAAAVARDVPVYRLYTRAGLAQLSAVVDTLRAWHVAGHRAASAAGAA